MTLEEFFKEHSKAAVGFSGGVDSSYLLYAGMKAGAKIRAYYVKSPFQPEFELADARKIAEQTQADLVILEKPEIGEKISENSRDRCYYCKKEIFSLICSRAASDGFSLVLDGTNASDDVKDRPGMRAIKELEVRSPLRECGLTKAMIREKSREAGLFTWKKPAYACLATRIPTGLPITKELLVKTEQSEQILFSMGFTDFRIRFYGTAARIQVPETQMAAVLEKRQEILERLKDSYTEIFLDLQTR